MAIDRRHLGYRHPPFTVTVDSQRLARFAAAVGFPLQDGQAAPPTFMKAIEGEHDSSRAILGALGVELKRVLHAQQQFDYHRSIHSGDVLQVERVVTDIQMKKGGALEFITIESSIRHRDGQLAGISRQLILVRNPAEAA
ncbi:N-terminal half of MaoC dehydratase [Solimonas aquatica]|uniref:N-terminal half of MaoC dehydratase n=1 Tax=Solimonas aquatica TaxID=489703 RepID=A0A1H9BC64_9GAMM|nr:MaoC family dehydratase N-terminal domain-containing protein [Solimonas aquatica]SEP86435.1 N-terminal half of MaoC dehydratase [Solimonas aquatica]